jgi:hypothetical protein
VSGSEQPRRRNGIALRSKPLRIDTGAESAPRTSQNYAADLPACGQLRFRRKECVQFVRTVKMDDRYLALDIDSNLAGHDFSRVQISVR